MQDFAQGIHKQLNKLGEVEGYKFKSTENKLIRGG